MEIDKTLRTPGAVVQRGIEQDIYLHRKCIPLELIDLDAEARKEAARRKTNPLFDMLSGFSCADGMCGV